LNLSLSTTARPTEPKRLLIKYDDPRIKYYSQRNKGAPYTLNKELSIAKGKYISIINSDDVYHTERLSCLFNTAESDSLKFLITDVIFINENSEYINEPSSITSWHNKVKQIYSKIGSLYRVFLRSNMAVSSSNIFFDS